jgi:putative NIF3 family GTP cyclohydrolase 1 type 2
MIESWKEVGRLNQELSSAKEIIKLLKNDIDLIHDHTNTDRHNENGNIRSNEWQTVEDNKKWKNNRRNDIGKPQQITTILN